MVSENDDSADPEPGDDQVSAGADDATESGEGADTDTGSSDGAEETIDAEQAAGAESADAESDGQAEDVSTTDEAETGTDTRAAEVEVTQESGAALAAVVSFLIPGVGNMMNGDTDRGIVILGLYIAWVVLAWGVVFFLIGSVITVVTFGLGFVVQLLLALVLAPIDLAIHVLAAVDAYQGSEIVDRVTVKVDEYR